MASNIPPKSAVPPASCAVLKFGGTSMGSFEAMQRCADIVLGYSALPQHPRLSPQLAEKEPLRLAVVVSAVAGVTDRLRQLFERAGAPGSSRTGRAACCNIAEELQALRRRHREIVGECVRHFGRNEDEAELFCRSELEELFAGLEVLCQQAESGKFGNFGEPELAHAYLQAAFLSVGEKLSSRIFAWLLRQNIAQHQPARTVTARAVTVLAGEALIRSGGGVLEARPDFTHSKAQIHNRLEELWQRGHLPVITGFTAADKAGRTTLLGRGGSDFSAALIAAALELPVLDIWTDVAGIYSCDPRIVPQSRLWSCLGFDLVSEMAYSGAKVVHPKSISIALQNRVAVIVRSVFKPRHTGTLILPPEQFPDSAHIRPANCGPDCKTGRAAATWLAGLVLSHDSLLLHMDNPNMLEGEGYISQIAGVAHRHGISIDVCATSETSFSFSIHHADCNARLLRELGQIGKIRVLRQLHKLCCVGHNIGCDAGFMARLLQRCQQHKILIQTISVGAGHNNVTILFSLPGGQQEGLSSYLISARSDAAFAQDLNPKQINATDRDAANKLLLDLHRHFLE